MFIILKPPQVAIFTASQSSEVKLKPCSLDPPFQEKKKMFPICDISAGQSPVMWRSISSSSNFNFIEGFVFTLKSYSHSPTSSCNVLYGGNVYYLANQLINGSGSSVGIVTGLWAGQSGDRIPVEVRFSTPVQTGPGAHSASCNVGTVSFPGVKSGRGVTLTPYNFPVPWSRRSRAIPLLPRMGRTACTEPQCLYSTAIPLLPLWAVRFVQSLSACTVHLYFYSSYGPYGFTEYQCLYSTAIPLLPL